MSAVKHHHEDAARAGFEGERVRLIFNPEVRLWYVYDFDENTILFSCKKLALKYAAPYDGTWRPKFAPNGAPCLIGTVTQHGPDQAETTRRLSPHPNAPYKLYFEDGVEEFTYGQHVLLDGSEIYVSPKLRLH